MSVCVVHSINNNYGSVTASDVIGCIEEAKDNEIKGWVFSLSGEPIEFQLHLNGTEVEHLVEWRERRDVAEMYGEAASQSGFVIQALFPNPGIKDSEACRKSGLRVLANEVSLTWFGEGAARNRVSSIVPREQGKIFASNLDAINQFVVKGWAIRRDHEESEISVHVNGSVLQCAVAKVERKDVSMAYDVPAEGVGFDILLPGCMWEGCEQGDDCSVEVFADGEAIAAKPSRITRGEAVDWISRMAEEQDPETRERMGLLALEHVRYGDFYASLPDVARKFIDEQLSKAGLEGYIDTAADTVTVEDMPQETVGKIALRSAMHELNELLASDTGSAYAHIKSVYEKHGLRGVAKEWYLNLAIQLTCDKGEFERLYELTDFKYLDVHKSSRQPHQLALLLPVLVSQGEVEQATEVLRSIARYINNSWLQTECLAYAVRYVRKLELKREADIQSAEGFRNAFIAVLDGMKGEWFSRLHDRRLVEVMSDMLAESGLYTDYHGRDVAAAAIKHYGLSPLFWELRLAPSNTCDYPELTKAKRAWGRLHEVVTKDGGVTAGELRNALESLEFFADCGNREAASFATELLARYMADGKALSEEVQRQAHKYLSSEPLRYAASPLLSAEGAGESAAERSAELVRLQRSMSEYRRSAVFMMQRNAAAMLAGMYDTLQHGQEESKQSVIAEKLGELERLATLLSNWQGMYLGVDLMLNAYRCCTSCGYQPSSVLMRVGEMIREAIDESTAKTGIPAPIISILSSLAAEQTDGHLATLLSEMREIIRAKFGKEYEMVLEGTSQTNGSPQRLSLHQDSLLLVDIGRDEFDAMAGAVRETWLAQAQARGIPCLFVRCGQTEGVSGDVLEVNVPDSPEYRTLKTLKMFEWAVANTAAQYVIKVDGGSYLDVDKFFDSLSYRKYHYYGRTVRCTGQKLNRKWHQGVCHSATVKKSLDKSPGASVFASGALGYSLSRFALMKLATASCTDKGKRLVAVSFAEDKLVGDLLAMAQIQPNDEDFDVYTEDYSVHDMLPEQVMGSTFMPGKSTLCKMAGRVSSLSLHEMDRKHNSDEIWPKKIWPTFTAPSLKANGNQLVLLSDREQMSRLLERDVVVVSVVRNEMTLLPQFLQHYRSMGVGCFIFVDNCSDDGTREYLVSQEDTIVYASNTEYKQSHYGVSWQQAVLGNHCLGKWVLLADADEFLVYGDSETVQLPQFVKDLESQQANGALLYMIDMYPYDNLDDARFEKNNVFEVAPYFDSKPLIELRFGRGMFSNSRNFVNGLRHRIAPSRINAYVSQKYALFKYYPWIRMSEGVHYAANMKVAETPAFFAHFKYHSGFKEKVELEVRRKQHFNGAEEYKKYAGMMAELSGGFGIEGISEKYEGSHSFVRLLEQLK